MKRLVIAILSTLLLLGWFGTVQAAQDCDNNAIIYCGASSKADLHQKLSTGDGRNGDIRQIYSSYGISDAQIDQTVDGTVTKDGRVIVDGQTVATGAKSVGRQDMPGSTPAGYLFIRPTSVSFQQDTLQAFIYMPGGQFAWAVIKSCGNPVVATATPKPVAPAAAPPQAPLAPKPLPTTGSTPIIALLGSVIMGYSARAYFHSRKHIKETLLHSTNPKSTDESSELPIPH